MEDLTLVVSNPGIPEKFEWNKEQFVTEVAKIISSYQGTVYTEDTIQAAKKDRAKLNALKRAIDSRRIEVKNAWNAPYKAFEDDVKEVTGLIDKTAGEIDIQVKAYEDKQKAAKKEKLKAFFDDIAKDMPITFDMVYSPKMLNASISISSAIDEIKTKVDQAREDIKTIDNLYSAYAIGAKRVYLQTGGSMSAVAQEVQKEQEIFEAVKQREKERRSEDNVSQSVEEKPVEEKREEEKSDQLEALVNSNAPMDPQPLFHEAEPQAKASFTVYGDRDKILELRDWLKASGLKVRKAQEVEA